MRAAHVRIEMNHQDTRDIPFMMKKPLPWYQPALAQVDARRGRVWNLALDCQSLAEVCQDQWCVMCSEVRGIPCVLARGAAIRQQ